MNFSENPKTQMLAIRITPKNLKKIKQIAKQKKSTVTDLVTNAALNEGENFQGGKARKAA